MRCLWAFRVRAYEIGPITRPTRRLRTRVEAEAELVRSIFRRYLELGGVNELVRDLKERNIKTKIQHLSSGKTRGGVPFGRGALYYLFSNHFYMVRILRVCGCRPHDGGAAQLWKAACPAASVSSGSVIHRPSGADSSRHSGLIRNSRTAGPAPGFMTQHAVVEPISA